jgi:hypothetical protein
MFISVKSILMSSIKCLICLFGVFVIQVFFTFLRKLPCFLLVKTAPFRIVLTQFIDLFIFFKIFAKYSQNSSFLSGHFARLQYSKANLKLMSPFIQAIMEIFFEHQIFHAILSSMIQLNWN